MQHMLYRNLTATILLLIAFTGCGQQATPVPTRTLEPDSRPESAHTSIPALGPAPTITPFEQIATMISDPTRLVPTESLQKTLPVPAGTPADDLVPVTIDSLDQIGIPSATYTDKNAGFSLDYPADWQETTPPDVPPSGGIYSASMISFPSITPEPKRQEGIPEGHTKIEVVVFQDRTYTLEEAVQSQRDQRAQDELDSSPTLVDEGWMLPSGLPGRHWVISGFSGKVNLLITAINGRKVIVACYGEPLLFNSIAGSLRID